MIINRMINQRYDSLSPFPFHPQPDYEQNFADLQEEYKQLVLQEIDLESELEVLHCADIWKHPSKWRKCGNLSAQLMTVQLRMRKLEPLLEEARDRLDDPLVYMQRQKPSLMGTRPTPEGRPSAPFSRSISWAGTERKLVERPRAARERLQSLQES